LQQLEAGKIQAKLDTLIRLVGALGTTWDQLLGGMIWVPGTWVPGPQFAEDGDLSEVPGPPIGHFQVGLVGGGGYEVTPSESDLDPEEII
jgi:hypothetical protein